MFRKLMALETEAARRSDREHAFDADPSQASLMAMAETLSHCLPMPSRFGVCATRHDF